MRCVTIGIGSRGCCAETECNGCRDDATLAPDGERTVGGWTSGGRSGVSEEEAETDGAAGAYCSCGADDSGDTGDERAMMDA